MEPLKLGEGRRQLLVQLEDHVDPNGTWCPLRKQCHWPPYTSL